MKERLTPSERFGLLVIDEPQDRRLVAPLCTGHAARILGCNLRTFHTDGRVMGQAQVRAWEYYGYDFISVFSDCGLIAEALGSEFTFPADEMPSLRQPLLAALAPDTRLPGLDLGRGRLGVYRDAVDLAYRAVGDVAPVLAFVPAPFTTAGYLLPVEQLLMSAVRQPDLVRALLDAIAERTTPFLEQMVDHGALPVLVDPLASGSVVSPQVYRTLAAPGERRLIDFLHRFDLDVILHICGDTTPILDDLPGTGADLLSLDRVALDQASLRIGAKVRLVGNFSTAALLSADPAAIESQTATMVAQARDNPRGYIISTGCEVPVETPRENLKAFVQAAKEVA